MSPDMNTNAYVAIPMEGMMRMTSSASPAARRRSSSNNNYSKVCILGGLIAVVLLLLGIPLVMRRCFGHGFHGTSMDHQMYSSDSIVMVWEEPVEDFHVEEEPKIEIYIGKPVVLTEEGDEIVETYENDDGQVVDHDNEYEEEPEDEVNSDYENEMVYEPIESDEGKKKWTMKSLSSLVTMTCMALS